MGRRYRSRSPENVVAELEYWKEKGWNSFMFYDDIFTFDMNRAEKICDLIIQKKLRISFKTSTRADRVNELLLTKMRDAGCVELSFGVESGHPDVLRGLKKGETVEDIVKGIQLTRKAGIPKISATFVIGGPGETWETFMASYNLAKSLPIDSACFFNLVPYPGAELFSWVEDNTKFVIDKEIFLDKVSYWQREPIFETDEFSRAERIKAYDMAFELYQDMDNAFKKKQYISNYSRFIGTIGYVLYKHNKLRRLLQRVYILSTAKFIVKIFNRFIKVIPIGRVTK